MGVTSARAPSWEGIESRMQPKLITMTCLLAVSTAAPTAEAEADADAQFYGSYPTVPAPNCVTDVDVLVTQVCTPHAEEICSTETVQTEEIEYAPICKDIVDVLCDAPAPHAAPYLVKRDAEADPQFFAPLHAVGRTIREARLSGDHNRALRRQSHRDPRARRGGALPHCDQGDLRARGEPAAKDGVHP